MLGVSGGIGFGGAYWSLRPQGFQGLMFDARLD